MDVHFLLSEGSVISIPEKLQYLISSTDRRPTKQSFNVERRLNFLSVENMRFSSQIQGRLLLSIGRGESLKQRFQYKRSAL